MFHGRINSPPCKYINQAADKCRLFWIFSIKTVDTERNPRKINPQKNTVMLGDADQLETEYMLAEQDKIVDERELFGCENLTVRIRYRSRPIPCRVKRLEDGRLLVRFLETASAIAPGQSAVFYDGRRVLGGAFIASQRGIGLVIIENEEL